MIRTLPLLAGLALAGCASPVVTRIDASAPAPLPSAASFTPGMLPDNLAPLHQQATDMVTAAFQQRGWRAAEAGDYLLAVTLSDRPAVAKLQAGDDGGAAQALIGPVPDRSNNKGCAARDHRLSIRLTDRVSGAIVYAGSAAEFHCKAALTDSLPHLVAAALDGLDGAPGTRRVQRSGLR